MSRQEPSRIIEAVCFDFDGTLAHFTGDFGRFVASFRSGLMLTPCDFDTFSEILSEELRREGPVTFYSAARATLGRLEQHPPEDLAGLVARFLDDYSAQMALLPGAVDVLNFCRDHELPLALITNGPEDMQGAAVRAVGLENYFERVLISGDPDVAVRKPHPRIFELACEALSSRPAETLMVGDNLEADVRGALQYGMQTVHLGAGAGPDYETVADVRAFGAWLEAHI